MAFFHFSLKNGKKGTSVNHCDYINREGHFSSGEKAAELIAKGTVNLPWWAKSPRDFFDKADTYERDNASTYKSLETALPCELTFEQNLELTKNIAGLICGKDKVGAWAVHNKPALMANVMQIHMHMMVCERIMTDPPEKAKDYTMFFKRYNKNNPNRSGYKKDRRFCANGRKFIKETRKKIAELINEAYRLANIPISVSAQNLESQRQEAAEAGNSDLVRFLCRGKSKYIPFRQFKRFQSFIHNSGLLDRTEPLPTVPLLGSDGYENILKSDIEFGDFLTERTELQLRKYTFLKQQAVHNEKLLPVLIKNFSTCSTEELDHILNNIKGIVDLKKLNNNSYIKIVDYIYSNKGFRGVTHNFATRGKLKKLKKAYGKLDELKKKKNGLILINRYSPDNKINDEIAAQQSIISNLESEYYSLQKEAGFKEKLRFAVNTLLAKKDRRKDKRLILQNENSLLDKIQNLVQDNLSTLHNSTGFISSNEAIDIIINLLKADNPEDLYKNLKALTTITKQGFGTNKAIEKTDTVLRRIPHHNTNDDHHR